LNSTPRSTDATRNPFSPGAGAQLPELAGREVIVEAATIALQRIARGRQEKSQMLLGLRGVGKTVLLDRIAQIAEEMGDTAEMLGISVQSAGPLRSGLIRKGMIWSPAHGQTDFTVPMFDAFMVRAMPEWRQTQEG
jgi:hypothetical protein